MAASATQTRYELMLTFEEGNQTSWSVHATYAEADRAGFELLCRWFAPEGYSIRRLRPAPEPAVGS